MVAIKCYASKSEISPFTITTSTKPTGARTSLRIGPHMRRFTSEQQREIGRQRRQHSATEVRELRISTSPAVKQARSRAYRNLVPRPQRQASARLRARKVLRP